MVAVPFKEEFAKIAKTRKKREKCKEGRQSKTRPMAVKKEQNCGFAPPSAQK